MYPVVYPRFFDPEAANDRAERRSEGAAGRLHVRVPDLLSLKFVLHEAWPGRWQGGTGYIRYVDLATAPALFELPCLYGYCRGGRYDLTNQTLAALARHSVRFVGACHCSGHLGSVRCTRRVRFVAMAAYGPGPGAWKGARLGLVDPGRSARLTAPGGPRASARVPS
ncbi:MAG: hypothetical protein MUF34_32890 [Polyangiaceae bacterium]|jgi:hypothetical protein|nr:hypothetical protein [Polyangiaceae bacterium]